MAGVDFPWQNIAGFYLCIRSFAPYASISGDKIGSPMLNTYGVINAELPNPDVDEEQRIISLPIKHKSDFRSLSRAHLDAGVKSGDNELVILYEHRTGLFGGQKACFHVAAFPDGTWQTFYEAVESYSAKEFRWPKPLFLFQPSSTAPFPPSSNLFSK